MDGGIVALITSGALIVGGVVGWITRQYWQYRVTKRQAAHDAGKILSDKKKLLEDMISGTEDESHKEELRLQLDEVNTALLGLHAERLRRTLKAAGLPPEEALIADGLSQLQPQQVDQLKGEIAELQTLPQSDSIWDLLALGNAYYYAEQYEDAKDIYDRILSLNPSDPTILHSRGVTYGQLGKYEEALADYSRSLEIRPDDPMTLSNRGVVYTLLERYDEAFNNFNRSISLHEHPFALYNRGRTYVNVGKYEEAFADFNRALELKPDDPDTLYGRGSTYYKLERYEEALTDFNRALELEPNDPNIPSYRGSTYYELERYEDALADFNRALELKPDDPDTLSNRGFVYTKLGRYEEALDDFKRVLQIVPDNIRTLYDIACLSSLWGKSTHALTYLEKTINKDKKYLEIAKIDKRFDNIREDPRFKKLIEPD